jgi:hypothetical protein
MFGVSWLVGINAELYRSMGRPDIIPKLGFITILYYLPVYYVAAHYNLKVFCVLRLVLCVVSTPLHVYWCRRLLNLSWGYLWHQSKYSVLACMIMAVLVLGADYGTARWLPGLPAMVKLCSLALLGASTYVAVLWSCDRPFVLEVKRLLLRAVK